MFVDTPGLSENSYLEDMVDKCIRHLPSTQDLLTFKRYEASRRSLVDS